MPNSVVLAYGQVWSGQDGTRRITHIGPRLGTGEIFVTYFTVAKSRMTNKKAFLRWVSSTKAQRKIAGTDVSNEGKKE